MGNTKRGEEDIQLSVVVMIVNTPYNKKKAQGIIPLCYFHMH